MIPFAATATAMLQCSYGCNEDCRCLLNGPDNPRKVPLPIAGSAPNLIHGAFGPLKSSSKTVSRSVQPFLYSSP